MGERLAFFKLGQRQRATAALNKAINYLPLVGKELLKARHRLPKTAMPCLVTIGGADEAYYFWKRWGQFWEKDRIWEWLKRVLKAAGSKKGD